MKPSFCVPLSAVVLAVIGSTKIACGQDTISVAEVNEYLVALGDRGDIHAAWRVWRRTGHIDGADWSDETVVRDVALWTTSDAFAADVSLAGEVRSICWEDGVLCLREGEFVTLSSKEARIPGRVNLIWDLLADSVYRNPGNPALLNKCIQSGQVLDVVSSTREIEVVGFAFDPEMDRFRLRLTRHGKGLRIESIAYEQAVLPADRPFEQRVLLRHDARVLRCESFGGIDTPVEAIMETRAGPDSMDHPDVRHFWRDREPLSGRWVLESLVAINDSATVPKLTEGLMPRDGDIVTDERLGLTYRIGTNQLGYNGVQYELQQPIEHVLDESVLATLEDLQVRLPVVPSEEELGRPSRSFFQSPWVLAGTGATLIMFGALGLLWRRNTT